MLDFLTNNLPPLNALRAFEAAARHESFSKAGDELHVTHAAISHQIKTLELWMGTALFDRAGRRVQLSDHGRALQAEVRLIFERIAGACAHVRAMSRKPSLLVGCIPSIAARWLVPMLSDFTARHPDVALQVMYAGPDEQIVRGQLDVLISLGKSEANGTESVRLFSRVNKPVCAPHYLPTHGPLDTPERIAAAPLLHDESQEGWKQWFEAAGLGRPQSLPGPVFQDFNLLATAVIAGHGVALCPVEVFRAEIARGDLKVLSDIATNADKGYYITTHTVRSRAVKDFAAWFTDIVTQPIHSTG